MRKPPCLYIASFVLALMLSVGCDTVDDDEAGSGGSTTSDSSAENPNEDSGMDTDDSDSTDADSGDTTADPELSVFDGVWRSDCLGDPTQPLQSNAFRVETITLAAGAFSIEYGNYNDASCSLQDALGASGSLTGSYTLGDTVAAASGLSAQQIDIVISEERIDGAPITGALDGATVLDLFAVDADTLFVGQGLVESKIGNRPSALNFDFPFRRQAVAP